MTTDLVRKTLKLLYQWWLPSSPTDHNETYVLELIVGLETHREFMRFDLNRHEDPNMLFLLET